LPTASLGLDGSGVIGFINIKFDNALGVVLQSDYRFGRRHPRERGVLSAAR
jgi:hypothetical protein